MAGRVLATDSVTPAEEAGLVGAPGFPGNAMTIAVIDD